MKHLELIRSGETGILALGMHPAIIQSILDFDFACGKKELSVLACITANRKAQKFFFGTCEVLMPCFEDVYSVPKPIARNVRWMLNLQSGRRAYESTIAFFAAFPDAIGGHIFAENVPERHATDLIARFKDKLIAGPSGVGILVPKHLKLGAIGGTDAAQIVASHLGTEGSIAVISTSGGMTNELIRAVADAGQRVSFSLCIGGERFPTSALTDVLMLAQKDTNTKAVVYFGELGGSDEYEIVELIKSKKLTKPVLAYVAGIIDEAFDEHMQFGHAKALVLHKDESARAKRDALRASGALAPDTFADFIVEISKLPHAEFHETELDVARLKTRCGSILSTREIVHTEKIPAYVKNKKLVKRDEGFSTAILKALLAREKLSPITIGLGDAIFESLIDHGGNVSGAVNTMISARAGKDMVSSLASGMLTIGPRFGGAINAAARTWHDAVMQKADAASFVESETRAGRLILGIGHRKYRIGIPDPRVAALSQFADLLKKHSHYDLARAVEDVTTKKNGSLILNVDGIVAAIFLDVLIECEHFTEAEIRDLIDAEFFNALFIIPRSVGFIAHFMEQKKNDEGLFRLPDELLYVKKK